MRTTVHRPILLHEKMVTKDCRLSHRTFRLSYLPTNAPLCQQMMEIKFYFIHSQSLKLHLVSREIVTLSLYHHNICELILLICCTFQFIKNKIRCTF